MALSITVGSVSVTPAADALADPVVVQPVSEAATFAAFAEGIVATDLAAVIFAAFPDVANRDSTSLAKVKWPPGYATTQAPYGRAYNPTTGDTEIQCVDERWTSFVNGIARGRESLLNGIAEQAVAIATGIKSAVEANFRSNRATLAGTSTVIVTPYDFTSAADIFIARRTDGSAPGTLRVSSVTPGSPGQFTVTSSNASENGQVSYLIVGA